jgi:hypothetical protein
MQFWSKVVCMFIDIVQLVSCQIWVFLFVKNMLRNILCTNVHTFSGGLIVVNAICIYLCSLTIYSVAKNENNPFKILFQFSHKRVHRQVQAIRLSSIATFCWTHDLRVLRRKRWPLCHAAMAKESQNWYKLKNLVAFSYIWSHGTYEILKYGAFPNTQLAPNQKGCQIFLGPNLPKREKYTKGPQTTPNGQPLYQITTNYTTWL